MGNVLSPYNLERLVEGLKNDEQESLNEIFRYYYPKLHYFSKKILKSEDNIDDVIQDVFLKLWTHRHNITNHSTFNALIYTITKNVILNLIRSKLKENKFVENLSNASIAPEYITQNTYHFSEVKSAVETAITKLPEKRKRVFMLSRFEGLANKEIARELNISEKTVEDHISHAVKFIKKSLGDLGIISQIGRAHV